MNLFPLSRCASATKIVCPLESTVKTQPQLQPALLRLSAMISQNFIGTPDCASFDLHTTMTKVTDALCPMHRAVRLWLVFPVPADVRDLSESRAPRLASVSLGHTIRSCLLTTRRADVWQSVTQILRGLVHKDAASQTQSATPKFRSRSHRAVIRVYDKAGNVVETHEHADGFKG